MRRVLVIALALGLMALSACAIKKKPTGEDFYQQGQADFADHEFNAAIENYQLLIDHYPFSPYAEDAEMKIGLSYYQMKDYAEAIGSLDDFQRMHPTSKQLEMVSYYIAMAYYDQIGREDQDQTKSEAALKQFQIIEQRFPEGSFAALAHDKAEVCREMLARHEMIVGTYYFKRANFRAAESRLAELMQKYPDTPIAPEALYELAQSLQKEGKKYSAAQAYTALLRHYPNTPDAPKAKTELKKLNQPVDTEEDPLPLVLAETGYGKNSDDSLDQVVVRQRDTLGGIDSAGAGGPSPAAALSAPSATQGAAPKAQPSGPAKTLHDIVTAQSSAYGADGLPVLDRSAKRPAEPTPGPATLRTVRLADKDPPMSVFLDLTGPVSFAKRLENGAGFSAAIVTLKD